VKLCPHKKRRGEEEEKDLLHTVHTNHLKVRRLAGYLPGSSHGCRSGRVRG
jgi:hypothetical protein